MSDTEVVEAVEEAINTPPPDARGSDSEASEAVESDAKPAENGKSNGKAAEKTAEPAAEDVSEEAKPYWPDDWRQKFAEQTTSDTKAQKKLLKQLERYVDPSAYMAKGRELESRFSEGNLTKIPGKDAADEERAEFFKALGVPEKPEDYFEHIKLDNDAVIGDADRPVADAFANAVHKAGATPEVVNAAMNWYFNSLEESAEAMDKADDEAEQAYKKELKEEWGPAYERYNNSIGNLFSSMGQPDLLSDLLESRMPDGSRVGNNPNIARLFVNMSKQVNPAATVTEDGLGSIQTVDEEIKAIEDFRRSSKREYFKDEKMQARYRELLDARTRIQAKA